MLCTRLTLCSVNDCNPEEGSRESVDAGCRRLTASWVREKARAGDASVELCEFFEEHERAGQEALLPPGGFVMVSYTVLVRVIHNFHFLLWCRSCNSLWQRVWWRILVEDIHTLCSSPNTGSLCHACRRVHAARPACVWPQAALVPLLPGAPHDGLCQRGRVQLPVHDRPQGLTGKLQGADPLQVHPSNSYGPARCKLLMSLHNCISKSCAITAEA